MNIYKDRLWLALLTGMVSLLMGFCEFYTWRIGWHPGSSPWNRESLLHASDIPAVLLLGAATFLFLSLVMKQAGARSPSPFGLDAFFSCFLSWYRNE